MIGFSPWRANPVEAMSAPRKRAVPRTTADPQELRDQEVLRANRELAAYFKGRRTEREAKAALKIVKAFIRDREHLDPAKRRPLPGAAPALPQKKVRPRKAAAATTRKRKRSTPPPVPASNASTTTSSTSELAGDDR